MIMLGFYPVGLGGGEGGEAKNLQSHPEERQFFLMDT